MRDYLTGPPAERRAPARLERGVAEGDVPAGADSGAIAAFFTTVLEGLSIQARDGAGCAALHASSTAPWRPGTRLSARSK